MNFDIIHGMCKGEEVPKKVFKQYQTVGHEDIQRPKKTKFFPVHLGLTEKVFLGG